MKKVFLLLVACCLLLNSAFSQNIQWQNTIGGNDIDALYSIRQSTDGGYVMGGWSKSNLSGDKTENCLGFYDYWAAKVNSMGVLQWENTIGGDYFEWLLSIDATIDGGCILGGYSWSNISGDKTENSLGAWDYWVVKLDSIGIIQWQNTIGGNSGDLLTSIQQTSDGGFILGGYSGSNISGDKVEDTIGGFDYWIVKIDSMGAIQWQNTIGGNDKDYLNCIHQTIDGGYIFGGVSQSNISGDKTEDCLGDWDYWIVKTDSVGNIQWENTIGGSNVDYLYSIKQTVDGGYIAGGYSYSNASGDKTENSMGLGDYWIIKLDNLGNVQWQNTIGGSSDDALYSIEQTMDGRFILGGQSYSNISGDKTENSLGDGDYWIIKLDVVGNILWQNTIGGSAQDELHSLQQTNDGGYILGGSSESGISGDKTESCNGNYDYWIVKINDTTITTTTQSAIQNTQSSITIFPNPAGEYSVISGQFGEGDEIRITDVLGKILFTKTIAEKCSMFNVQCWQAEFIL